jgi:hypothetical protein
MTDTAISALARAVGNATPWRVGQHYGIHVYAGNTPIATFHTVADAARAVEAVNLWITLAQQLRTEKTISDLSRMFEQMRPPSDSHEDNP